MSPPLKKPERKHGEIGPSGSYYGILEAEMWYIVDRSTGQQMPFGYETSQEAENALRAARTHAAENEDKNPEDIYPELEVTWHVE